MDLYTSKIWIYIISPWPLAPGTAIWSHWLRCPTAETSGVFRFLISCWWMWVLTVKQCYVLSKNPQQKHIQTALRVEIVLPYLCVSSSKISSKSSSVWGPCLTLLPSAMMSQWRPLQSGPVSDGELHRVSNQSRLHLWTGFQSVLFFVEKLRGSAVAMHLALIPSIQIRICSNNWWTWEAVFQNCQSWNKTRKPLFSICNIFSVPWNCYKLLMIWKKNGFVTFAFWTNLDLTWPPRYGPSSRSSRMLPAEDHGTCSCLGIQSATLACRNCWLWAREDSKKWGQLDLVVSITAHTTWDMRPVNKKIHQNYDSWFTTFWWSCTLKWPKAYLTVSTRISVHVKEKNIGLTLLKWTEHPYGIFHMHQSETITDSF